MKNQWRNSDNHSFVPLSSLLDVYLRGNIGEVPSTDALPLPSGYSELDNLLGGMQRSELLIVGGQTGLGKTSLAHNICTNAAKAGQNCGIFSLEMSRELMALRMLVAESGADSHRLRLGLLSENEENLVSDAVGILSKLPVWIDDSISTTAVQTRNKAGHFQRQHGLDLLVVDYLQLIPESGVARCSVQNRVQEINDICLVLKQLARDLDIAVIGCAQLSRAAYSGSGRRPKLSDLKDGGGIEEIADTVVLLSPEHRNFTEEEWEQHAPGRPYPRNLVELIVAKHRHGPTGSFHLYFRDNLMRFDELARYEESVA